MTVRDWVEHITTLLTTSRVSGSHGIDFYRLRWGQHETYILVLGEIHQNPKRCRGSAIEMVRDLIIRPFLACGAVTMIVETFFHRESMDPDEMRLIMSEMQDTRGYPFENLRDCLSEDADNRCLYRNSGNALKTLRMWFVLIRSLYADLLRKYDLMGIRNQTHKVDALFASQQLTREEDMVISANARMEAMDIREGNPYWNRYAFPNPFVMSERSKEDKKKIGRAASTFTKDYMRPYLKANPISKPSWEQAFLNRILDPQLRKARELVSNPTVNLYKDLFVAIPDVMSILIILSRLSRAESAGMEMPVFVFEGGFQHLLQIETHLSALGLFTVTRVVPRLWDNNEGSCAASASASASTSLHNPLSIRASSYGFY